MTDLQRASLTLHRVDIQAAIDRGHLRLAAHMLADYPQRVLRTITKPAATAPGGAE